MKKIFAFVFLLISFAAAAQDDDFEDQVVIFDADKSLFPDMEPLKPGENTPEQEAMIMGFFMNVPYAMIKDDAGKGLEGTGLTDIKKEITKDGGRELLAFSGIQATGQVRFIVEHLFIAYAGGTIMIRASYPENKKAKYSEATKRAALTARVKQ